MLDVERFWGRVDRSATDGCWPWTGARMKVVQYGAVRFDQKTRYTHRVAWELTNGPIPPGLFVCHRCDNPPCCNPGHLFLGTHAANMADMTKKGRHHRLPGLRGEASPSAKVSDAEVAEIRRLYESGMSQSLIAVGFRISQTHVSDIIRRRVRV